MSLWVRSIRRASCPPSLFSSKGGENRLNGAQSVSRQQQLRHCEHTGQLSKQAEVDSGAKAMVVAALVDSATSLKLEQTHFHDCQHEVQW